MKSRIHRIFSKHAHVCWISDETKWLSDSHFVLNGIFKNNAITFAYFPKTRWLLDLHSPLKKFLHVCWKSDEIQDSSDFQQTCACLLKIRWNQVIIRPSLINHEGKKDYWIFRNSSRYMITTIFFIIPKIVRHTFKENWII